MSFGCALTTEKPVSGIVKDALKELFEYQLKKLEELSDDLAQKIKSTESIIRGRCGSGNPNRPHSFIDHDFQPA